MSITLTGRQRDFLATYSYELTVELVEQNRTGAVRLLATGNGVDQELWLPSEGFLSQPTIEIHDWEVDLDRLPEQDNPNKEDRP